MLLVQEQLTLAHPLRYTIRHRSMVGVLQRALRHKHETHRSAGCVTRNDQKSSSNWTRFWWPAVLVVHGIHIMIETQNWSTISRLKPKNWSTISWLKPQMVDHIMIETQNWLTWGHRTTGDSLPKDMLGPAEWATIPESNTAPPAFVNTRSSCFNARSSFQCKTNTQRFS